MNPQPADESERRDANLPIEGWLALLQADPRPALLSCADAATVFLARTRLLDQSEAENAVLRRTIVADVAVRAMVGRLAPWTEGLKFGGHASPAFPPALLRLLHLIGVRSGDFQAIDACLDAMLAHQAGDGRFLTPGAPGAAWTSLPCDHHAILEILLLFGRGDEPAVGRGLRRLAETFAATAQGLGWLCLPDPVARWRGPGRKADFCPQVTLEALRLFALAPAAARPPGLEDAARTILDAWRNRLRHKPYMFGHGRRFAAGKWPPTWYDAAAVLEALAPWRATWRGPEARPEHTRAIVGIADALASNFDAAGMVTPQSCHRGFEAFGFGQKKIASTWATARLCAILRPYSAVLENVQSENAPQESAPRANTAERG